MAINKRMWGADGIFGNVDILDVFRSEKERLGLDLNKDLEVTDVTQLMIATSNAQRSKTLQDVIDWLGVGIEVGFMVHGYNLDVNMRLLKAMRNKLTEYMDELE